jgi:hypothetical protein
VLPLSDTVTHWIPAGHSQLAVQRISHIHCMTTPLKGWQVYPAEHCIVASQSVSISEGSVVFGVQLPPDPEPAMLLPPEPMVPELAVPLPELAVPLPELIEPLEVVASPPEPPAPLLDVSTDSPQDASAKARTAPAAQTESLCIGLLYHGGWVSSERIQ